MENQPNNTSKFLRNYVLNVQFSGNIEDFITVKPPFTIEFDIRRDVYGSANDFSLRIYNLSQLHRNQILKDYWTYDLNRLVMLQAGYGADNPNFPMIIHGYITEAWSVREGNNFITYLTGLDGGNAFLNATTNQTFPAGTTFESVLGSLIDSMNNFGVKKGALGNYPNILQRGNAYSGSTTEILSELTGNGFFIDNGRAFCLQDTDCIASDLAVVIDSSTGLLGTPIRQQQILTFDIIFEPRIFAGQQIELKSIQSNFNGFAKVISVRHKGIISDAICGDAVTTITVTYGPSGLTPISI